MTTSFCWPVIGNRIARSLFGAMVAAVTFIAGIVLLPASQAEELSRPNLLLVIADDLGYGDLGCTGSTTIRTPHIDSLAESGALCSHAYAASAVCSPSRAGLLTGRDPRRFGYEGNLNSSAPSYATRPDLLGLPVTEHTIAAQLKAAGYATALVGKWHLGGAEQFHPNNRGFDYFCGMLGGGHSYFPDPADNKLERNGAPLRRFSSEYLTDFFTDEGIRWIDARQDEQEASPWLLVMSYNAPHTPMQATEKDKAAYVEIQNPKRRTYAAMVSALDRGIGRLVEHLAARGLRDNTMIVFVSDNGGATDNGSWNGHLSGAKGTLREGGIRVPMIWSWPKVIQQGQKFQGVISSLDILPTFLAAANASPLPLPPAPSHEDSRNRTKATGEGGLDGSNQLPILAGSGPSAPREFYWRLQGQAAVIDGDYKLIRLGHRPAQLFKPSSDPSEQHDYASENPDQYHRMYRMLGTYEASLGTVPLFDSSPYWWGDSAKIYDNWKPRPEPK